MENFLKSIVIVMMESKNLPEVKQLSANVKVEW